MGRCLASVLAQQGVELEVVIGDDASDDDTLAVAREVDDPRVAVHGFGERAGLAGNWNRCWQLAQGDYAALVGQDDWLEPDWGRSLVGLLEAHPDADLAFGRRRFEFADAEARAAIGEFFEREYPAILARFYARISDVVPPRVMIEEALRHRFEINLIGEPAFSVVRRKSPAAREGFHPDLAQLVDWEFAMRFFIDRPILHCPRELGVYRIHASGASVENVPRHYAECVVLLSSVLRRFGNRLTDEQRRALGVRRDEVRRLAADG